MKKLTLSMSKRETILGWIYLPLQFLVLPTAIVLVNFLFGNPLTDVEINLVFFAINFIGTLLIFWNFLNKSTKLALHRPMQCLGGTLFGFIVYWLLNMLVGMLVQLVYPDFFNVNDASLNTLVQENAALMTLGTVLLVPISEEVLFRGLIFGGLYNRKPILAYAVSTFAFAGLHVINYIGLYAPVHLLLCFLQYIPAGVCLALAYAKADNIWAAILIHITVNQIGMLSMR